MPVSGMGWAKLVAEYVHADLFLEVELPVWGRVAGVDIGAALDAVMIVDKRGWIRKVAKADVLGFSCRLLSKTSDGCALKRRKIGLIRLRYGNDQLTCMNTVLGRYSSGSCTRL